MRFLIIDLVSLAYLELIRLTIDHESYPRVGCNRNVNSVALVKRLVTINVWRYFFAGEKFGGHRAYHRPAWRVQPRNDVVHHWQSHVCQPVSTRFLTHNKIRPALDIDENQDDGLSIMMHLIFVLPIAVFQPGRLILREDRISKGRAINFAQLSQWRIDIQSFLSF